MNEENNSVSNTQVEFENVVEHVQHEKIKHSMRRIIDRLVSTVFRACIIMAVILSIAVVVNKTGQQPWNPSEVINELPQEGWIGKQVQKVKGYNTQVVDTGVITWAMHKTLFTNKVDKVYLMIPYIGWIRVNDDSVKG